MMMLYDWYKIFNLQEFISTGLVSRTRDYFLSGMGSISITITRGNLVSLVVDDVILPVQFSGEDPFVMGGYAIYKDDNDDVYLGFKVEE